MSGSVIDAAVEAIGRVVGANRVLLIRAEKDRALPVVTITHEFLDGLPPAKHHWQRRDANGTYSRLLADVSQKGLVKLATKDMPESVLRTWYEQDGVLESTVLNLGHPHHHVQRYLSCHFARRTVYDALTLAILANALAKMLARGAR